VKHKLPILLLALAFPAGQAALSQEPPESVVSTSDLDKLPGTLDSFVRDAINEGLLSPATPVGTGPEAGQPGQVGYRQPAEPRRLTPPAAPVQAGLRLRPKQSFEQTLCGDANPLDFSDFNEFVNYDDLIAWRGASLGELPETQLAKAYIALGLNEEARAELIGIDGRDAVALRELAYLMEGRRAVNMRYFRDLTDCYGGASTWLMAAQLASNDQAGVVALEQQLNSVRRLPLQLRISFTSIAVPALDRLDQKLLAEKLITMFTDEQISLSSRLTFARAVVDLSLGDSTAEARLRQFFASTQFSDEAASALRRHGFHISPEYELQFVDRLVDGYGKLPTDIPVETSLDLLLRDLNDSADYDMTLRLAELPAAKAPDARARLADHYVELVDKDLKDPDPLHNLEAMDALLKAGSLLEDHQERGALFGSAAALAVHLGLRNLAEKLADEVEADEDLNYAQAELAFRLMDVDRLDALADQYAGNARITQLAALNAIETGRTEALRTYERRLPLTPEIIVPLIEADAARGDWIVSPGIYEAARAIDDETYGARARRVLAMKTGSTGAAMSANMKLAEVTANLDRISRSLNEPETEMR